jgi:hypothetical protein
MKLFLPISFILGLIACNEPPQARETLVVKVDGMIKAQDGKT